MEIQANSSNSFRFWLISLVWQFATVQSTLPRGYFWSRLFPYQPQSLCFVSQGNMARQKLCSHLYPFVYCITRQEGTITAQLHAKRRRFGILGKHTTRKARGMVRVRYIGSKRVLQCRYMTHCTRYFCPPDTLFFHSNPCFISFLNGISVTAIFAPRLAFNVNYQAI